jgi:hypothetical protein
MVLNIQLHVYCTGIPGEYMTTQRETQKKVLKIVDDLLEDRITPEEALLQAKKMKKVGPCDDPPSALTTILFGIEGDPCVNLPETENKEIKQTAWALE